MLANDFSNIGTYWEKANQNEIDIIAINEDVKTFFIAEVKINPKKIDMDILKEKSQKLIAKYKKLYFTFSCILIS